MAGTHRSVASSSWPPTARILGALFAGSAVMFAAVVVQGDSPPETGSGTGVVAGALPGGTATRPSPETPAPPQDGALRTAADDVPPAIAPQSGWTVTKPSPAGAGTREVAPVPDPAAGQAARWGPGTTTDWEPSLREALVVQQSPAHTASAPPTSAQDPPTAGDADQPDHGVVEDLLGHLGVGF